jgi:hypothetical protein
VKAAVRTGEKLYVGFLDHEEPAMRDSAAYLLAFLESPASELAERAWKRFESERDESVRASLLLAFGRLARPRAFNQGPLLELLVNSESKSIKLAAAMSLVHRGPTDAPADAIVILVEAARWPEEFSAIETSTFGKVDGVEKLTLTHLLALGEKPALAAEQLLAQRLPAANPKEAVKIAEVLLTVWLRVNPQRRDTTFNSLNEREQRIVRLIAKSQNIWRPTTRGTAANTNYLCTILHSSGLPNKQNDLLRFVGEPANSPGISRTPGKKLALAEILKRLFKSSSKS